MYVSKLVALCAALFSTVSAIPIDIVESDLALRAVDVDLEVRDLYIDENELYARNEDNDLILRDAFDDFDFELVRRKLPVSKIANNIVKAQGQKAQKADGKKNANAKTASKASGAYHRDPANASKDKKTKQKEAKAAGDRAITQTRKDKKAANAAKLDAKKKTPDQKAAQKAEKAKNRADRKAGKPGAKPAGPAKTPSTKTKVSKDDKKAAADHLKQSGQRMKNTANIPGRKDSFTVSNAKNSKDKSTKDISGKDVRKAVFMSNVNGPNPVGQAGKEQPKQFNNDPYSKSHPDKSLAGNPTIPGLGKGKGQEYPVLSGSKTGWTGDQKVGTARVITEKGKDKDTFHGVIAHDQTKGGDPTDHYLAQKKTGKK